MKIVEIKNLTVEYPGVRALDNVSFSIEEKDFLDNQNIFIEDILSKSFFSKIVANLPIIDDIVNFIKAKDYKVVTKDINF